MTAHHKLKSSLTTYRIGNPEGRYPIWSSEGAYNNAGRWNQAGHRVIYTSCCLATAQLEIITRLISLPTNQFYISVKIPKGTSYTELESDSLPGWYSLEPGPSREFATKWYEENKSCILIVPSVVSRPDKNIIINTQHPDFQNIEVSNELPVVWDNRLFDKLSL